ncbi:PIG-L family deacetylase [Arthrospiribacter ruber]|uniref:PIG-L family deacetylase n=1 Tax=Arthrospiribacter ruber TaxID=2487934 RepID=A0A951IY88_9BACT|nr:PIG-L family deacetylase [Arthrospiribacter ruber]MBW3468479.1 PIG-L family deacetylase [Arthrospiribacter ruber]
MKNPKCLLLGIFSLLITQAFSQYLPSSVLYHDLLRFEETKRVLYVAAHPDDENTRLISYLANAENAEVAYLSLTRGDGGQNLIGKELGIELGLIRTHELLKARETDGGRQLFSRALDFGFSKNPDETFNNWDREKLLSDVVWIIRNYQPDIIINRFNTIPGTTHGHHTSSAILSSEAFEIAADPAKFSEQLKYTQPWQAKRIFWNAYQWGGQYEPEEGKLYHEFEVGQVNPFIGTTYSQIAADSRTMHKSQGFGSTAQVGAASDFIQLVDGESFDTHPFEGVESRWLRLNKGAAIQEAIQKVKEEFNFLVPERNIENLLEVRMLLDSESSEEKWFLEKKAQLNRLILDILGVKTEFIVKKEIGFPGDKVNAEFVFNNPSSFPIQVSTLNNDFFTEGINRLAQSNEPIRSSLELIIPMEYPVSQPFWLENPIENSLFGIEDQKKIGPPVNGPNVSGKLKLTLEGGYDIELDVPLEFKYNDQVDGEVKQPFTLVPEVNVSLDKSNLFLIPGAEDKLTVEVSFRGDILKGKLEVEGLEASQYKVSEPEVDERRKKLDYTIKFLDSDQQKKTVRVRFKSEDGRSFTQDTKRIIYSHIPNLTYFVDTDINLVKMDLKISGQKIAYIPGAGDDVPDILKSLGYNVNMVENGDFTLSKLKEFSTVIVGIRAFNVNQTLANNVDKLMQYVEEGGNVIVQYNTASPLLTRELGPYPFSISRDRVTVEGSPVKADFSHPVLSYPNQVTEVDFDGWVQERGLYFVSGWDENYTAPLEMKDPGENATKGSLIHTKFGKGTYTYTGISWFRQLPAGVPGAVKIFVNLIEQGGGE